MKRKANEKGGNEKRGNEKGGNEKGTLQAPGDLLRPPERCLRHTTGWRFATLRSRCTYTHIERPEFCSSVSRMSFLRFKKPKPACAAGRAPPLQFGRRRAVACGPLRQKHFAHIAHARKAFAAVDMSNLRFLASAERLACSAAEIASPRDLLISSATKARLACSI